ncbi:MAG: DEAD/DEAH box helicase [Gordonibacter sp.]|uniref:DEAD/DEAH box helicase n=1 Tax=Gordonibacter sp. TaxID=1968902 RepID=UPI002FCC039C
MEHVVVGAVTLRPYQQAAREGILREWIEGRRKTLLELPTGTGKTIVFAMVTKDEVDAGGRVLILAHRGELLDQAADKLHKATGLVCSVEKADRTCLGEWFRVVVGSVQTLMRTKRLEQFPHDYFSAIVIDEAHHALSDSYQAVLDWFPEARVLGVTATPDRGDRRNLGNYFDSIAYQYTLPRAIKDGYLCPIKTQTVPLTLDLTGVKMQSGDYSVGDLGTALDPYLDQIADEMIAAGCLDRKTVVFLPLVATSKKFCGILAGKGFAAAEVNGESADRAEVLAAYDAGKYNVLCNSMLLTEGWDCPSVDCVVVLRPTKVRSLYCQMIGRGTRLSPETGKTDLLLLDFLWHVERHELCRPAHLIAESNDIAHAMTERLEEDAGCALDLEEVEQEAATTVMQQREESLAKELEAMRKRKRKLVDPLQYEMSIQAEDLVNYVPEFGWQMAPASDKQVAALEKAGIAPDDIECAGKASVLLDRIAKRRDEGLATPRQIRQLEQRGFKHAGEWEFEAARKMIDRIASNGWRTPATVDPASYTPPTSGAPASSTTAASPFSLAV